MVEGKMNIHGVVITKSNMDGTFTIKTDDGLEMSLPISQFNFIKKDMKIEIKVNIKYIVERSEHAHSISNGMNNPVRSEKEFYETK